MFIPVEERILSITKGTCKYNSCKKCNGLCNNCAVIYDLEVEEKKKSGIYTPTYAVAKGKRITNDDYEDYEEVILAMQERYYN